MFQGDKKLTATNALVKHADPANILQAGFGFWPSKVLLTAVKLGVFTTLGPGTATGPELGAKLGLHPRGIYDFLDALVALGFLGRDGDGPGARYKNTEETALFLDKSRPEYVGGILEMCNDRLFRFWGELEEALKTGKPQNELKFGGKSMFEELYSDPNRLEQFMAAMSGLSAGNFRALAEKFDFSKYGSLCDVGGATGLLACYVAKAHPRIRCISFDLPVVEPIARKHILKAGLSSRVSTESGDFFAAPLPKADVITMGMILHDWNLEKKKVLIRAVYDALPKSGVFIAIENLIDDARRKNAFGLMMSLNMLVEFGDAFDFSGADFAGWCREAGFARTETLHLAGPCSAAIAYK